MRFTDEGPSTHSERGTTQMTKQLSPERQRVKDRRVGILVAKAKRCALLKYVFTGVFFIASILAVVMLLRELHK